MWTRSVWQTAVGWGMFGKIGLNNIQEDLFVLMRQPVMPVCRGVLKMAMSLFFCIPPLSAGETVAEADRLPDITVVAGKRPELEQWAPLSLTAVTGAALDAAGARSLTDAVVLAPNARQVQFSSRQLGMPYFRGLGASPGNPAVGVLFDGVPQLHGYAANIELLDLEQLEFVRGPQGALYGRGALGGLIQARSRVPSLAVWQGAFEAGAGRHEERDARFSASGPLVPDKLALGLAGALSERRGFTRNTFTGNDADFREGAAGRLQLHWLPAENWSARLLLFGERDRDGDFALGDLAALRNRSHRVARDFEGRSDRDLLAPTLILQRRGERADLTMTTGFVRWRHLQLTDLDYSPVPAVTRRDRTEARQLTQEFRLASPAAAPVVLDEDWRLKWQAGLFLFGQNYRELAVNNYAPFVLDPLVGFPVSQTSPKARLRDRGAGVYGQAVFVAREKLELGIGLRGDYERKRALLETAFAPAIAPATRMSGRESFSRFTPQFSAAWHFDAERMLYATAAGGYRAGGFNPVAPAGAESYDEESSRSFELGAKTSWFDHRLKLNLAVFHTLWDDLQLNLPMGRNYYVANAGDAFSRGVELEAAWRVRRGWDVFAAAGWNTARFSSGATSLRTNAFGVNTLEDVGGNRLIYAPRFTVTAGTQFSWALRGGASAFVRAEVVGSGRYQYNPANTAAQAAYALVNLRAGLEKGRWSIEGWVNNAFDREYEPVAFEFPNFQSGFLAESGAPLSAGVRVRLSF